jgi:ADP-ribose pyrophosphatase
MKSILFGCFALAFVLSAKEPTAEQIQTYLELLDTYPNLGPRGNVDQGEIELLRDPEKIRIAAKNTGRDIGIVYEDRYWIWVNDPVKFPSGSLGVYGRIITRGSLRGCAGCAILPRLPDGRIMLNCNYRHATRSWELEIPRGFADAKEKPEECARRELKEETGFCVDEITLLGKMPPDTGQSSTAAFVFLADVHQIDLPKRDESEAIDRLIPFSIEELREGFRKGSLLLTIRGVEKRAFLRDPFLTFGLFLLGSKDQL